MMTQEQLLSRLAETDQAVLFREALGRVRHEHYFRDGFAMEETMAIAGYRPFRCEICAPTQLSLASVIDALWEPMTKTCFDAVITAALGELPLFSSEVTPLFSVRAQLLPAEAQVILAAKTGNLDRFLNLVREKKAKLLRGDSSAGSVLRILECYGYVTLQHQGIALSYGWNGRFEPWVFVAPEQAYVLLRAPNGSEEMRRVYNEIKAA